MWDSDRQNWRKAHLKVEIRLIKISKWESNLIC